MSAYREWFRVTIEHAYHGAGGFGGWRVLPGAQAARLLDSAGAVLRQVAGGFAVFAPGARLALLPERAEDGAPLALRFHLFVDDPLFATYTAPAAPPGQVLLADSRDALRERSGAWRLHAHERLDASALAPLAGADDLPPARLPSPRRAALQLRIEPGIPAGQADATRYLVRFDAAASHWKYVLQGALAGRSLSIVDADGEVSFTRLPDDALAPQLAAVFLSDRALGLRARSARRFELRERAAFGDKVLMKRLPVACAGIRQKAEVDGHAVLVSEIFVNY